MKVSVIIPVYNGSKYLAATLETVLAQSYPLHEIIVIDDGSTDSSPDMLKSYGDRLRVSIEGDSGAVLAADCPPLLLQPLVENALRHDLDCHDGESDITLRFSEQGGMLHIHISNSVREVPSNPGMGMGLRNIEARLRIACGSGAGLRTARADGRFVAEINMPMYFAS